jgi:hypothetical protein
MQFGPYDKATSTWNTTYVEVDPKTGKTVSTILIPAIEAELVTGSDAYDPVTRNAYQVQTHCERGERDGGGR